MNLCDFKHLVSEAHSQHPFWFEGEVEDAASDAEISSAEKLIGVNFPQDYRDFLSNFGGGYFAHSNVFSVKEGSKWNIVKKNREIDGAEDFVAISDDQCGGFYGFLVENGTCNHKIFYKYIGEAEEPKMTHFDIYEFLAEFGLEHKRG